MRLVCRKRGTLDLFCIRRLQVAGHRGHHNFAANLSALIVAVFWSINAQAKSRIEAAHVTHQHMTAVKQHNPLVVENMRAFKRRNVKVACGLCMLLVVRRRDSSRSKTVQDLIGLWTD